MKCGRYRKHDITTTKSRRQRKYSFNICTSSNLRISSNKGKYLSIISLWYFYILTIASNLTCRIRKLQPITTTTKFGPSIPSTFNPNSQPSGCNLALFLLLLVLVQATAVTPSEAFMIPEASTKEQSLPDSTADPFWKRRTNYDFIHNSQSEEGTKLLHQFQAITSTLSSSSETNSNRKSTRKMLLTNSFNREFIQVAAEADAKIIEQLDTQYFKPSIFHTIKTSKGKTHELNYLDDVSSKFQYQSHYSGKSLKLDTSTDNEVNSDSQQMPLSDTNSTAFKRRRRRTKFLVFETGELVTHDISGAFEVRHDWLYPVLHNKLEGSRPLGNVNHNSRQKYSDPPIPLDNQTKNSTFANLKAKSTFGKKTINVAFRWKEDHSFSGKQHVNQNAPIAQTNYHSSSQGPLNIEYLTKFEEKDHLPLKDMESSFPHFTSNLDGEDEDASEKQIKLFSQTTIPTHGAHHPPDSRQRDETSGEGTTGTDNGQLRTKRVAMRSKFSITTLHETFIMQEKEEKRWLNHKLRNSNATVRRSNYHMFATPQGGGVDASDDGTVYAPHVYESNTAHNGDTKREPRERDSRHSNGDALRLLRGISCYKCAGHTNHKLVGSLSAQSQDAVNADGSLPFSTRGGDTSLRPAQTKQQAVVFVVDSKPVVKRRVNSAKFDHTNNMMQQPTGKVLQQGQPPSPPQYQHQQPPQHEPNWSHTETAYHNQQEKSFFPAVAISSSVSREQPPPPPPSSLLTPPQPQTEVVGSASGSQRAAALQIINIPTPQSKQSNSPSTAHNYDNRSILPSINALTEDYQPSIASDSAQHHVSNAAQQQLTVASVIDKGGDRQSRSRTDTLVSRSRARREVRTSKQTPSTLNQTTPTAATKKDQQIRPEVSSALSQGSGGGSGTDSISKENLHDKKGPPPPEKAATTTGNESTSGRFIILAFLAIILLLLIITALSLRCYTKLRKRRLEKDLEKKTAQAAFAASSDLGSVVKKNYTAYETTAIPNPRQRERRNASFMDSKNEVEKDPQEKASLLQSFDTGSGSVEDRRKSDDNHQSGMPKSSVANAQTSSSENVLQVADYRIKKAGSFSCEASHPLEMWRRASLMSQSSRRRGSYMFVHKDSLSSLNMLGVANMPNNYPITSVSTSLCTTTAVSNMNNLQTSTEHHSSSSFSASPNPSPSPNKTAAQMTAVQVTDIARATTPLSMNTLTAPTIFEISCSNPDLSEEAQGTNTGGPKPTLIYQPQPIKENLLEPGIENYNHKLLKRSRSASKHNTLPKDKLSPSERRRNSGPGRCEKGLLTPVQQRNLRNSYAMRFYSHNSIGANGSSKDITTFDSRGYLNKYKKTRQKVRMGTCVCQTCIRYLKMDCEGSLKEDLYNQISGVPYLLYKIEPPMFQNHYTLKPINLSGIFNEAKPFCDIRFESYHTTASAFYPHKIRLFQARNHHFSVIPRHTLHSYSSKIQTSI